MTITKYINIIKQKNIYPSCKFKKCVSNHQLTHREKKITSTKSTSKLTPRIQGTKSHNKCAKSSKVHIHTRHAFTCLTDTWEIPAKLDERHPFRLVPYIFLVLPFSTIL